jgi:hypothetical protein
MILATTLSQVLSDPLDYAGVWGAAAAVAQFIVIFATAGFAILQLRHAQKSNQMAALREINTVTQSEGFFTAQELIYTRVPEAMRDAEFRYQVMHFNEANENTRELVEKISIVGNAYENLGRLVKHKLVSSELVFETWSPAIIGDWANLQDYTVVRRRSTTGKTLWENFEYLSVCADAWLARHSKGTVALRWRHKNLVDKWREKDLGYESKRKQAKNGADESFDRSSTGAGQDPGR